jgi:hypothetical protein
VLETADFGGAGILSGTGNDDALVLGVTLVVTSAAAEDDITLIGSGPGNNETSGIVDVAFCVSFARTVVVRDTRIIGLTGNDDALRTVTSEMTALGNAIKRALTCIWGFTGNNNTFILRANKVLAEIALVLICGVA